MRTVNHRYDAETMASLHEQVGGTDQPIREALGYLSLWNLSSFPVVDICVLGAAGDMEIAASYRKEPAGAVGYQIGAVWHGDHFGFHS